MGIDNEDDQVKEDLLDLIAGAQSSRLNEQRAPWAVLPGLTRSKQVPGLCQLTSSLLLLIAFNSTAGNPAKTVGCYNRQGLTSR